MTDEQRVKITTILQGSTYGVIATAGQETPESALITIAGIEDMSIVVGSLKGSRKNDNIAQNNNVSFVIGWDPVVKTTIQIEGEAVSVPHGATYANEGMEYFKIVPRWMRYSNFAVSPLEVWEVKLG